MFTSRVRAKQKQIESLKRLNPYVQQKSWNPDAFHIGLRLSDGTTVVTVVIELGDGFPQRPPRLYIRSRQLVLQHPWLDSKQELTGCPELQKWRPNDSDVGVVLQRIMHHFMYDPPRIVTRTPVAPGPYNNQGFSPQVPGHFPDQRMGEPIRNNNIWGTSEPHRGDSGANHMYDPFGDSSAQSNSTASPSRQMLPEVPEEFPELDHKLTSELQVLEFDEDLKEAFLLEQNSVKSCRELDKSCKTESLKLARRNLEFEEKLRDMVQQRDEKRETVKSIKRDLATLSQHIKEIKGRFKPKAVAHKLDEECRRLDAETEQYASEFVERKATEGEQTNAINKFMDEFMDTRKKYHDLAAKAEILRQKGFENVWTSQQSNNSMLSNLRRQSSEEWTTTAEGTVMI